MFDSFFSTKYSELDVYVLTSKPVTKFYEECSALRICLISGGKSGLLHIFVPTKQFSFFRSLAACGHW